MLVILYTNGNIDLYRPADGRLVNLPAIKQAMAENLTVDRLRVQGTMLFSPPIRGLSGSTSPAANSKGIS